MTDATNIGALSDFEDGVARAIEIGERAVAVVRIGDAVHAIDDICSHANVSLSDGEVWCDELELECPKHGSAFSLTTGEPATLPATTAVNVHTASVVDGHVMITLNGDDS